MKKVVFLMVAMVALVALGCEDKKSDAKPSTTAAAATGHATAAPAKTAAPGGGW
jgi:hypothetical protein